MKTKTYTVYKYDELPEDAQAKVLEKHRDINVDYDWWKHIYEDANTINLELNGFDLDHKDIGGGINGHITRTLDLIQEHHGQETETYQLADGYKGQFNHIVDKRLGKEEEDEAIDELEAQFDLDLKALYLDMLQKEYDYLVSDEAVIETIRINEYDFTLNGNID